MVRLLSGAVSLRPAAHTRGPLLGVRGDRPHDDDRSDVLLGLEDDTGMEAAVHAGGAGRAARYARAGSALLDAPAHRVRASLADAGRDTPVVVESHRPHGPHGAGFGADAHALLHHSPCPVFPLPTG
ncbi:hypothetical protein [Streptomyces adonidis]|uniref:Uncharacterized protein n=1 Tax=Streptomyces sp. NBC_00093 TaxID=2975649 RepID=A0AAU2ADA6_9ACTN